MTLIVCLKGPEGMVLAADSRGTFGDPRGVTAQNDTFRKVYRVTDHVGVLVAGSAEIGTMLMQEVSTSITNNAGLDGVTPVMNKVRETLIAKYNEWFPGFTHRPVQGSASPNRPELTVIIGGYELTDGVVGEQKIYSLDSPNNFAPMLHDYGFGLRGIPQYALYLLNRFYSPTMLVDQLLSLGAYVITETASQDGKVGGPVRMIKIRPAEGCYELTEEEVSMVLQRNADKQRRLRELW